MNPPPPPADRSDDWYASRLALPARGGAPLDIVIDTDAANEIDDPFAIAWALRRPARLRVLGLYAAPFSFAHRREALMARHGAAPDAAPFCSPAEGMVRSHDEILRVLDALGDPVAQAARPWVLRGSDAYLPAPRTALRSSAVEHLIETARARPAEGPPLYVVALGCVTNIASALLLAPDIARRIVVVWTSGYPSHAPLANDSFNLEQDLWASQWLLDSGVPHVYLPGYHVGAQLRLSLPEMERYVAPRGAIGRYLHHLYTHNPLWPVLGLDGREPFSWVIWDILCIAWLLDPDWVPSTLVRTPHLDDARRWRADPARHPMREGHAVERDAVFADFFAALGD